ncbi:hypothetical protein AUC68_05665 [Methyloceanibacter methanicus]|uniref:Uncharacterized protein n=1 Tax=Methyloceanibacter methanicus TaxID=1774968 RepID=A0A1E3W124_9HYPH|nr:hypothetical protein AUC68_05665 [Methyloceanibacter methanicus]
MEALAAHVLQKLGARSDAVNSFVERRIEQYLLSQDSPLVRLPTEVVGAPYDIVDSWSGTFSGKVLVDRRLSGYVHVDK